MQLLIFLFLSWFFIGQSTPVESFQISQQDRPDYRIALSTVSNPSFTPTEDQFEKALASGITLFEIASSSNVTPYTEKNFSLLFSTDIPYPTVSFLQQNRNQVIQSVADDFIRLSARQQSFIAAVGLFRHPADFSPGFELIAGSIADSISGIIDKPLYYHSFGMESSTPPGFSFFADHIYVNKLPQGSVTVSSPVMFLEPSASLNKTLTVLSELMEASRALDESIIILPAEWFFQLQASHPSITSVLKNYTSGRLITMPLPAEDSKPGNANPSIILLLLIFAGLIIQYKYQPVLLQYVGRYFFNHSFFMADILDNRMRSVSPGLTFMGIHSLLNGLFVLTFLQTFFSQEGLQVLSYYFAPDFSNGYELFIAFIVSALIGLAIHLISVFWLRLLNRQINSFSKAINLYIWPFILTLIPVSVLVINLHTMMSGLLAILMSVIYLLTWLVSFAVASINAARRLEKYRALNIFFTVGLYSLIFTGICAAFLMIPSFYEPIELAFMLP